MKTLALSILLSWATVLMSANETSASSPLRPVIRLHCAAVPAPISAAQAEMFCQQMIQALAELSPGTIVRRVSKADATPGSREEVSISLHVVDQKTLYAAWRQGPDGAEVTSAPLSLDAQIDVKKPAELKAIARDVLRMSPSVLEIISQSSSPQPESKP